MTQHSGSPRPRTMVLRVAAMARFSFSRRSSALMVVVNIYGTATVPKFPTGVGGRSGTFPR